MKVGKKYIGVVCVLTAAMLWGCMGIFVRGIGERGLSSMDAVAVRVILSAVVTIAGLAIYDRSLLKIKLKDLWLFILSGLISIVGFTFCYFTTIENTSLSVAAVLLYTSPIIVIFLSALLFKEKLTSKKLIACGIAFCGCVLVTGVIENSGALSGIGLMFGLLSAVGYALYSIFGRLLLMRGYSSLTITAYIFLIAAVGVIPLANWGVVSTFVGGGWGNIGYAVLMALLSSVIPYGLYTIGLSYVEAGKASVMASIEPVVATIVGFIVFGETLSILSICGIGVVLLGVAILNMPQRGGKS